MLPGERVQRLAGGLPRFDHHRQHAKPVLDVLGQRLSDRCGYKPRVSPARTRSWRRFQTA